MKIIYLIKSESSYGDVSYKIGVTSRDPIKRLRELQTGNPNKLELLYTFQTKFGNLLETSLHNFYQIDRLEGEWFNIDPQMVNKFLEVCQKSEENFILLEKDNSYFQSKIKNNRF